MSDMDFGFVAGLVLGLILAVCGIVQGWVAGKKAGIRSTIDYLWGYRCRSRGAAIGDLRLVNNLADESGSLSQDHPR